MLLGIKPVEPVLHQKNKTHTCELFKHAPAREIKYNKFIADDDSTTFAHFKTNVPYGLEKNLILFIQSAPWT